MFIDPRTLVVTFIIGDLLMALLLAVAFRGRQDKALKLWITSLFVQSVGWGLMLQCGPGASPFYPLAGFSLLSATFAILTSALVYFLDRQPRYAWPWWPVPLAVLLAWLSPPDSPQRHLVAEGAIAVQMFLAAGYLMGRRGPWRELRVVMGGSGLLAAAIMIPNMMRLAAAPAGQLLPCLPRPGSRHSVAYLVFFIARFAFLFGFLLLMEARQRTTITRLATLDPLTEAYNRRSFMELAEKEFARCRRNGRALSMLFIDMDDFKRLNDQYGHQAGDQVLRQVKAIADRCLRREDLFGRYGGEEFCLLAPETDRAGAQALAERLRQAVEQDNRDHGIDATASIGVATFAPVREDSVLIELIEAADQALYRAKAEGRNKVAA